MMIWLRRLAYATLALIVALGAGIAALISGAELLRLCTAAYLLEEGESPGDIINFWSIALFAVVLTSGWLVASAIGGLRGGKLRHILFNRWHAALLATWAGAVSWISGCFQVFY